MRRRAALARGFLRRASLLLLDEPFTGLDIARRISLVSEIEKLRNLEHKAIVIVTHDIDDAILLADQVLVLGGTPVATVVDRIDLAHLGANRALDDAACDEPRRRMLHALTDNSPSRGLVRNHVHAGQGTPDGSDACRAGGA